MSLLDQNNEEFPARLRDRLLEKLVSRTLWVTVFAATVVTLDAFGLGNWPSEVRLAAAGALVLYIGGEKAKDLTGRGD